MKLIPCIHTHYTAQIISIMILEVLQAVQGIIPAKLYKWGFGQIAQDIEINDSIKSEFTVMNNFQQLSNFIHFLQVEKRIYSNISNDKQFIKYIPSTGRQNKRK